MNENREHEFLDLATGFILGNLAELEERRFLDHLAEGCPTCEEALEKADALRLGLALSVPAPEPSAQLKARVVAAVERAGTPVGPARAAAPQRQVRTRTWNNVQRWAVAAVLVLTVGLLSLYNVRQGRRGTELQNEIRSLQSQLQSLRDLSGQQLAVRDQQLELLRDPNAACYEFAPQPNAPSGLGGKLLFNPNTRRAVIALDNATLPVDKDYELWGIRDGVPVSLGVVPRDDTGAAVVLVDDVGDPTALAAFAVSLEDAGGSRQATPEGPVVLVAALGS